MSPTDTAFATRQAHLRKLHIRESNRERLMGQMGGGAKAVGTLLSSLSNPVAASSGGTTLLRSEGKK